MLNGHTEAVRIVLFLASIVAAAALVASASARTVKPHVAVAGTAPVKVVGRGFHAREKVRVVVTIASYRAVRNLRASAIGSFAAVVANTPAFDPCNATLTVTATGAGGSRAEAKVPQRQCPPA